MKKIIIALCVFVAWYSNALATNYFVDPANGLDTNDGLSWSTPLQTLSAVDALIGAGAANTHSVFVKGGAITFASGSKWQPKSQNYYFSCAGTETSPSQRQLQDVDGNGVVESWEFANPTQLFFTTLLNSSGYVLNLTGTALLDGATVTASATAQGAAGSGVGLAIILLNGSTAKLQNSILKSSTLTNTFVTNSKAVYGVLFNIQNNCEVKDCMVEKNTVTTINQSNGSTANNNCPLVSLVSLNLSTSATNNPKMTNVIIRNNKAIYDFSDPLNSSTCTNLKGLALAVGAGSASYTGSEGAYTNCVVYNNELVFNGNSTVAVAPNASLIGPLNLTAGKLSFKNCVIANNKITNMAYGAYIQANSNYTYAFYNNVLWNNQKVVSATASGLGLYSTANQASTNIVSNNVMDVDVTGIWGTATYTNNVADLAQVNTGAKAPNFSNPTALVGVNRVAGSADSIAIAQARWSLTSGSYLIGKGTAYSGIDKDIAGVSFSATNPSAGAYEFVLNPPTDLHALSNAPSSIFIVKNKLIAREDVQVSVYCISGSIVKHASLLADQEIELLDGIYIVKALSKSGLLVNKLIVK